jgi:hypothetical protein
MFLEPKELAEMELAEMAADDTAPQFDTVRHNAGAREGRAISSPPARPRQSRPCWWSLNAESMFQSSLRKYQRYRARRQKEQM